LLARARAQSFLRNSRRPLAATEASPLILFVKIEAIVKKFSLSSAAFLPPVISDRPIQ
jgi:hypothetical protein